MAFVCPVNTPRLTSPYGFRIHPIKKVRLMHGGVDLVNNTGGKVPVYSTAEGTVRLIKDTKKSGYGKYVIVTHNILGIKYESLYAHLDSYSVKVGQKLKKGQQLGVMGTTGASTGIHLHFEIHKGTYNYGGGMYPSSVDPMKYIDLKVTPSNMNDKGELTMSQYNELKKLIDEQAKTIKKLEQQLANKTDVINERKVSKTHAEAWKWATDLKLLNGEDPEKHLNREQFATVLQRYHKNVLKK